LSDTPTLTERIDSLVDGLHDRTVSDDPFTWEDALDDRQRRKDDFEKAAAQLRNFVHVSKRGTVLRILGYGTALPLVALAALWLLQFPPSGTARLIVWGLLGAAALVSAIIAGVVGHIPSVDDDISVAAYTVPRGWSFSRMNGDAAWRKLVSRFSQFNRGDEDQSLTTRIWGYMDEAEKRPFMLFRFDWVEVVYVPVVISNGKTTTTVMQRQEHSYDRHGMFLAVPEANVHFRIAANGAGTLGSPISLEFEALSRAAEISCDTKDELAVRQFLSPAVQEAVFALVQDVSGMLLDVYPGFILLFTDDDFLHETAVRMDETARNFSQTIATTGAAIESFRGKVSGHIDQIRKYND